jgi:DNA mismatch repair protein MutL
MSIIRILPEAVANKIAAGEVVERPASVAKELLENSLDAAARQITVEVEGGGRRLIRVADDGCGMTRDDTLLAFERHATSKIRSAEDLTEVATLGFRGEALPSIAAVSRLVLETRQASEKSGTRLEIEGGRLRDVKETAWAGGTCIEVRDLFYNTPARRKFLKSESTELGHIASLVTHYALAHPAKQFRLASLTNEILNVPPAANHRERLYQVMGGQILEQLIEFGPVERRMPQLRETAAGEDTDPATEAPLMRISGFVSRPEVQKLNRNQTFFFVNRRLVRDRLVLHALNEAYRNILPAGMFPVALIFLELPPAEVDVNVHPSKTEVRFRHSSFTHDLVRDSIRQGLLSARPVPAFPMPGRSSPAVREPEETEAIERLNEDAPAAAEINGSLPSSPNVVSGGGFRLAPPAPEPVMGRLPLEAGSLSASEPPRPGLPQAGAPPDEMRSMKAGEFPSNLQPLGQIEESFIVAANAEGLWIIDQHVAHERILFERHLNRRSAAKVEGQRLLLPIVVELRPDQQAVFQDIGQELAANGFEAEPFGQRSVAVKTAPAGIRAEDIERLLLEILDGLGREARALSLGELRGKIAASVACHAAIKVHTPLDQNKMEWLLSELSRAECPMTCPHGRPVVLKYGLKEIQKAFKRI